MPGRRDHRRQSCRPAASRDEHADRQCGDPELHTKSSTFQRRTHHTSRERQTRQCTCTDYTAAIIAALKQESGKDLLAWGGATFAQSLSRLGLVDEYRLVLQPIALGAGLPLFKDLTAPLRLELVEAQTYATGAALHVYRPIRD